MVFDAQLLHILLSSYIHCLFGFFGHIPSFTVNKKYTKAHCRKFNTKLDVKLFYS